MQLNKVIGGLNVETKYKEDLNRTLFKQSPMRQAFKHFEEINKVKKNTSNKIEFAEGNLKIREFISKKQQEEKALETNAVTINAY